MSVISNQQTHLYNFCCNKKDVELRSIFKKVVIILKFKNLDTFHKKNVYVKIRRSRTKKNWRSELSLWSQQESSGCHIASPTLLQRKWAYIIEEWRVQPDSGLCLSLSLLFIFSLNLNLTEIFFEMKKYEIFNSHNFACLIGVFKNR